MLWHHGSLFNVLKVPTIFGIFSTANLVLMIKFFRILRYHLLAEGKTGKYLQYALGEIVLVVIGILIALSINNWNTDRKNQLKERTYLINLQTEIEKHIVRLEDNLDYTKRRLHSIDYVLKHVQSPKEDLIVDSMIVHLNWMQWVGTIRLDTNIYQDMLNTGNLNLIRNKEVRLGLQNYFYLIERYRSATATNNDLYINNAISFYMKHLSMGHIIETTSEVDSEGKPTSKRALFELWDYGYESAEMKEFENNLYFRRTDLDLELARNRSLSERATELVTKLKVELNRPN
jgi:hypothetical protein